MSELPVCEHCGRTARYTDSVPDPRVPGAHPSECGYRTAYLCEVHARGRKTVATARVEPIDPAAGRIPHGAEVPNG